MNNLNFRKFITEFAAPWTRVVKQVYGAEDTTNPPQLVLNSASFMSNGQKKTILSGTMLQKVTPDDPATDNRDPKKSYVTVKVMNQADAHDSLMPDKGHGQPSKYAGETFTIPRHVYNWMIQPGPSPQQQPPQPPPGEEQPDQGQNQPPQGQNPPPQG